MKISLTYLNNLETILEFDEKSEKFCHEINDYRFYNKKRLEEANNDIFVCIGKLIVESLMISEMGENHYGSPYHEDHEFFLKRFGKLDGSKGITLLKSDVIDVRNIEVKDKKIEIEDDVITKKGKQVKIKREFMIISLSYLTYNMTFKMQIGKKTTQILEHIDVKKDNNNDYLTLAKWLFGKLFRDMILPEDKDMSVEEYFEMMRYQVCYFGKIERLAFSERIEIKDNNFKPFEPKVSIVK